MRWTTSVLLRPVTFGLAILAAVLTGQRTGSFWFGLLAFLVAMGVGRALRPLVRGRLEPAARRAIWPAAATAYAVVLAWLGLPSWAAFVLSFVAASLTTLPFLPGRLTLTFRTRGGR